MEETLITCPEKDKPDPNFCFVWDCNNMVIGYIYRDSMWEDERSYCFAPFSHGLAQVLKGVTIDRARRVLEAFDLKTCEGGLDSLAMPCLPKVRE